MKKIMIIILAIAFCLSFNTGYAAQTNCRPPCEECPPGPPGDDGADGQDGQDGNDGIDGQNGSDGSDGLNGDNGSNGNKGTTGKRGKDGADGRDGSDGITTMVNSCPDCLEDRIDMAVSTGVAIPFAYLDTDKTAGFFLGLGDANRMKSVGGSAILRISSGWTASAGIGANIDEVCKDDHCLKRYDQFEYITFKAQVGYQF